jgi:hypothetical protein
MEHSILDIVTVNHVHLSERKKNVISKNSSDNPDMSFTHQNLFPVLSTSPTHYGFLMSPMLSITTLQCATEILDEVEQLKSSLKTMENIEKAVNMIN